MKKLNIFLRLLISGPVLVQVMTCAIAQELPNTFTHTISNGSEVYTINFTRFSSRGPLFEVAVQKDDGTFNIVDVGDPRTYIGRVNGQPGAVAACVRRSDGSIYTRMTFENGFEWIDRDGELQIEERELTPSWPTFGLRDGGAGHDLHAIDVYVDLTNRYYGTVGGSPELCMEMVDFSMTAINLIYLRDVNHFNRIGRVVIRASLSNDPYIEAGSNLSNLHAVLKELNNEKVNGPDPGVEHDLSTVIQSMIGGGVAGVGVVGHGTSANGGFTTGDFAGPGRHELGHNWGLSHFDGRGENELLSPEGKTINSGNGLAKMSAPEMELVLVERDDSLSVITNLGTTAPDMPPRAGDDRVSTDTVFRGESFTVAPLINDNDSNGERINIVSFESQSLLGAVISQEGDLMRISLPENYSYGYDHFRYQISDTSGRTSTAVVHLQTRAPELDWAVEVVPVSGGRLLMQASDKFSNKGVIEYLFEHVNGSQHSDWQNSPTFITTSFSMGEEQTYRVYARLAAGLSEPSKMSSAAPMVLTEGLLHADTYNRSSLNGSSGQSGQIGTATYTQVIFDQSIVDIFSNQLRIDGPSTSGSFGGMIYINSFNFGAPLMSAFDEVSVKVDIIGYSTVGNARRMGIGIGQTLMELEGQEGADGFNNPADLLVAYRKTTNVLEIYKNGVLTNSIAGIPGPPAEMKVVYHPTSLLAGSSVSYSVYFDNNSNAHTSGSFTWSQDYANYLSLSSNLTGNALFDNWEVSVAASNGFSSPPLESTKTDYVEWSTSQGSDIGSTGEDFDGDGLTNNEERIWGLDPTSHSSSNPYIKALDSEGNFEYTRRSPALSGLEYSVWSSVNLEDWALLSNTVQSVASTDNTGVETIRVGLPASLDKTKMFIRVEANLAK